MPKTLILIPSRMSATRLPGKPLLKINNLSIISHVMKRAKNTEIGRVVVCTEDQSILEDVEKNGGEAVLTGSHHKSGTDRIFEGYQKLDVKNVDYVLNLQGDEPSINENDIINLNNMMIKKNSNIGTLGAEIKDKKIYSDKNIVKVITEKKLSSKSSSIALSFKRKYDFNEKENIYQHIGIYAYNIKTLQKFVKLSQTQSEIDNKLEQLRALDNKLKINVILAKSSPIGVDTKEDYLALKKNLEYKT
jgi:3-deoxy-manno-octulosonate cytidylyltransferase (CMP-KDO synthetase)|tara:strand:- start:407 stop:1147 length:741 start_codon:yes stop_codon:yes gene_type:complete